MAADMLVKLYDLPDDWSWLAAQAEQGITIRKPIGPEKHLVLAWIREHFNEGWASEAEIAISNSPRTCFAAIKANKLVGFSCYDATALGMFGPIGVAESYRGQGIGKALLLAALLDMKLKGYQYAIIGLTNLYEFYNKAVGAVVIPDSFPGFWQTWVREN
ncbi:MAG: GNAT family N-acetyltransferase [Firmicutes bacterium]|nr:GNAT family N-acetyltransferase [Bacillota bacterium]